MIYNVLVLMTVKLIFKKISTGLLLQEIIFQNVVQKSQFKMVT